MRTQLPRKGLGAGGTAPLFSANFCCGQTAGWIKMPHGMMDGRPRTGQHCIRCGYPAPPQGHSPLPQFLAYVCCGQMAGRIKMPLGTKVGLVAGHMVKKQKTIDSTLNKDC